MESINVMVQSRPVLQHLPQSLPLDGAIHFELEEGVPIFRASQRVQERIESLLFAQKTQGLIRSEEVELTRYEEMDDYLSFLNRVVRNLLTSRG